MAEKCFFVHKFVEVFLQMREDFPDGKKYNNAGATHTHSGKNPVPF